MILLLKEFSQHLRKTTKWFLMPPAVVLVMSTAVVARVRSTR